MNPGEAAAARVAFEAQIARERIDHKAAIQALRDQLAHIQIHAVGAEGHTIEVAIAGTDCFMARVGDNKVLMLEATVDNHDRVAQLEQFIGRIDPTNTLYLHSLVQLGLISMTDYELINKVRSELRQLELDWSCRQDYVRLKARYEPSAS